MPYFLVVVSICAFPTVSGTTIIAGERVGRRVRAIELAPEYVDVALLRWRKDSSGAPEHVDFLVKDRQSWLEHIRPHLLDSRTYERRIDFDLYRDMRNRYARQQAFLAAGVVAAFDLMSPMCGHVNLLMGMALDADWVRGNWEVF